MGWWFPFTIARTRHAADANTEAALEELKTNVKRLVTAGTDAPTKDTPSVIHIQWQNESYSRVWIKNTDGTWK